MYAETGLLQKMVNSSGNFEYACIQKTDHKKNSHPHLKCRECESIMCLPEFPEAYKTLLNNYQIKEVPMLMDGVCKNCLDSHKA